MATYLRCEAQTHTIAFDRNDAIYALDPETKKPRKVVDGIFPSVSPDGARIAFNTVEKNGTTYDRHIAVVNIADGKTTVFKDVPSTNSYYPVWTRDGQWIAFTLRRESGLGSCQDQAQWNRFRAHQEGRRKRDDFLFTLLVK